MSTETHSLGENAAGDALGRVDEAVCAFDDEWQFTFVNDRAAAMLDHEPRHLLGGTLWEVLPEMRDSAVGDKLQTAMDTQEPRRFDHYDESLERWLKIRLYPSDDGMTACFYDITDEQEQELARQQTRLRALFDKSPNGIIVHDEDGAVIDANDTQLETLGIDRETLLSKNVSEFEVGITESELQELWAGMSVGEVLKAEGEHRRQNGDTFPVEVWVNRAEVDGNKRYIAVSRAITERKESKRVLEEERDMFAQGPAVVFKWKNESGWPVEYVSENVTETFGYTPDQLQSGSVPYTDLVHDEDLDRVAAEVESQSDETTERFSHDPYRMVTSAGDVRWVTDNTKVIRNDGEITHYLGYLIDITEQKRLEQSLRSSERSLRELTDIASDTEQSFEEKLSTLLELGRERLDVPYGFLNRIDDGTQHVVQAVGDHPELQTGSEAPLSETYCRKTVQRDGVLGVHDAVEEGWDGDPAYERFDLGCYIGGTVFVDGDRYGTLCFAGQTSRDPGFDETERAFVELLVQWISYELAGNAFETKLQEMNDTARRLMAARSRDEIAAITIESTKSVLDMSVNGIWWHDDAAEELVPAGMTEESDAVIGEQPTLRPGASLAYDVFETGAVRTYDDLNEVDGLHNTETPLNSEIIIPLGEHGVASAGSVEPRAFSDTDQSLLEVLSATVEAALNRAQREETLRETQQKLKQSNEELEQFAYAASHDLQEPLRTVSSYLTLLERRYGDELDEDASEFIDFAVDGADRMREMIQALLAYSRIDTRGQSFEPIAVDTLFDCLTQDLTVTIEETGAVVSTPTTDLTVSGDESQLSQLFQNLVGNGIKYNDDQPRVDISATPQDEMVQFEVTDNGIGMDPDQTDDIFEVFQRLHTREEFDGTGIGLSVCRKIVERHGGDIRVDSEPGVGTTFTVTLPQGGDDAE